MLSVCMDMHIAGSQTVMDFIHIQHLITEVGAQYIWTFMHKKQRPLKQAQRKKWLFSQRFWVNFCNLGRLSPKIKLHRRYLWEDNCICIRGLYMKCLSCQNQFYWFDSFNCSAVLLPTVVYKAAASFLSEITYLRPVIYEKLFMMSLHQVFAFTGSKLVLMQNYYINSNNVDLKIWGKEHFY